DGPIPRVISIGIVAPGGVPVTGVEKIRRPEHEHDVVVVAILPPTLVMPFCVVVAKGGILVALPVLAAFNVSALLEPHRRRFRDVWLFRNVEVLRLKGLTCRDTSFPWFASNIFCGPISIRNLTFALCLAVFGGFVRLVSSTLCLAILGCFRWWSRELVGLRFTHWLCALRRTLLGRSSLFLPLGTLRTLRLLSATEVQERKRQTANQNYKCFHKI